MSARKDHGQPRSVLVFRIGSLGDTLVALPALWAVRNHFSGSHIVLLSNESPERKLITPRDVLEGSGVCDEFLNYQLGASGRGRVLEAWQKAVLLANLRRRRFDTLAYLAPSKRSPGQIARDRAFFGLAGIRRFLGMEGFGGPAPSETCQEADLLLRRLAVSGIPAGPISTPIQLGLGAREESEVAAWLAGYPPDGGRPWLAVGPGGKKPVTRWPAERYAAVVEALIERFDLWPVVFGGPEDSGAAQSLIAAWGRGYNASGTLAVRPALAALRRCAAYLGNDTGTMHMAAASGAHCIVPFASHAPGLWFPYGEGHHIFQTRIECEGCQLVECRERSHRCLLSITVEQVIEACAETLSGRNPARQGVHA